MGFADKVTSFMKSLTGGEGNKDGSDPKDQNLDGGNTEEGEEENEDMEKGLVDATEVLGSLVTELKDMNKSLKALVEKQETLEKSQGDVGEAIVGVAEMVAKIANAPIPPKSAMAKGNLGGGAPAGAFPKAAQPDASPTVDELERAQDVLVKAVREGEISIQKSEQISSSLQKAMVIPGYKMDPADYNFLVRKMTA
jgi:hypothetical protein